MSTVISKSFQATFHLKVGFHRLQELELHDIDESEFRALLFEIPELWKKNSGRFDLGLQELFKTFGETDSLVFGVHIYSHGNSGVVLVVLTEYSRDSRVAVFRITAIIALITYKVNPQPFGRSAEVRLRSILEKLSYEDLEMFANANQYQGSDEVFVCPKCKARYMMRILTVSADGKVQCQNCLALIDPKEIHVDTSHDS